MWLRWALCTLRWIEVEMCREMSEARNANAASRGGCKVAWRTVESTRFHVAVIIDILSTTVAEARPPRAISRYAHAHPVN